MSETQCLSLDKIRAGERVVVRALRADRQLNGRFMLLGLAVGTAAEVLQNYSNGPILIRARNTLVAIGRDEARKILVEAAL